MATSAELDVLFTQSISVETSLPDCEVDAEEAPYVLEGAVTRNVLIPAYVFVFLRESLGPPPVDKFSNVASVVDVDTYSPVSPAAGQSLYRATSFRLRFATIEALNETKTAIKADLGSLLVDWNIRMTDFEETETCTFPTVTCVIH